MRPEVGVAPGVRPEVGVGGPAFWRSSLRLGLPVKRAKSEGELVGLIHGMETEGGVKGHSRLLDMKL